MGVKCGDGFLWYNSCGWYMGHGFYVTGVYVCVVWRKVISLQFVCVDCGGGGYFTVFVCVIRVCVECGEVLRCIRVCNSCVCGVWGSTLLYSCV